MGASLDKPKTDKHNEHGCGNGLRYGVASMQGWRVEMEDAHCAITGLSDELKNWSFFAVFDGHAGAKVSAHCAENLMECIVNSEEFRRSDITKGIRYVELTFHLYSSFAVVVQILTRSFDVMRKTQKRICVIFGSAKSIDLKIFSIYVTLSPLSPL